MGLFSRAWMALMRRNMVYLKRNWLSTVAEILLPALFVYALVAIKNQAQQSSSFSSKIVNATYPNVSFTPLTFTDYVTALRASRVCIAGNGSTSEHPFNISGIASNGNNWPVPLVKCNSYLCTASGENALPFCEFAMIAVSGTDAGGLQRAQDFKIWIETTYPSITNRKEMPFNFTLVQLFNSTQEMDNYVTQSNYGRFVATSGSNGGGSLYIPKIAMGIVWQGNSITNYNYQLRQNSTNFNAPEQSGRPVSQTTPSTKTLTDAFGRNDFSVCTPQGGTPSQGTFENSCTGQYMYNGVLTFQRLVNDYILQRTGTAAAGYNVSEAGVQYTPFPTRPYLDSGFFSTIEKTGPLLLVLGLLYPVASMISYMVREKELRQKELMKMMSVFESDIGCAWFVTFMTVYFFTATLSSILSTLVYEKSDGFLLWIFWILSFISTIVFCMAVATSSSKTTRAILIGTLVFFCGVFLTLKIDYKTQQTSTVQIISLHPVAVFSFGLLQLGNLEDIGLGLTFDTIAFSDTASGYTFKNTLTMLCVDIVLWGWLTWYLNRVIKPDYGQALPFYFPFTSTYWCPSKVHAPLSNLAVADKHVNSEIPYEPVSDALQRQADEGMSIEIHDLCKVFGGKPAVDRLNLSMYSGQITALLGHNGAGKTTTINMLTGSMAPSEGYATVAGKDIRTELQAIRQDIGICLQHDCLFPYLTVREHIQFFARLKGMYRQVSRSEAEAHVDEALRDVALFEKRNSMSTKLSGGMKRKLSVAMAFCGGSKVVILDEPTSGMDPFSRRFTWNVIRQYRQDRCIILTTHFMDEADILGDRIAIMSEGQLRCAGSSFFLKKFYGVGYQLTIERTQGEKDKQSWENGYDHGSSNYAKDVKETAMVAASKAENENEEVFTEDLDDLKTTAVSESNTGYSDGTNVIEEGFKGLEEAADAKATIGESESSNKDAKDWESLVGAAIPEATLLNDVGTQVRYQLPLGATSKFAAIFEKLDTEVDKRTIVSYGMSMTTLDEVFLLVARGDTTEDQRSHLTSSQRNTDGIVFEDDASVKSSRSRMDLEKDVLFTRHLKSLFIKRAAYFKRDKKAWMCTTILPSLFVLIGFLITIVKAPTRNLPSLTLNLSALNPNIAVSPVNPIPFNSPDNPYSCQPGLCTYQTPIVYVSETTEVYAFCGTQANLGVSVDAASFQVNVSLVDNLCTIDESTNILRTLDGFQGAAPVVADVETVLNSSISLYNSSSIFAASQYGAIWYTHELGSTIVNGSSNKTFVETVKSQCVTYANLGLNYTTAEDCDRFRGLGYVIQYNFTGLHTSPLYQTLADQALVRYATNNPEFTITTTIAPLPITKSEEGYGQAEDVFLVWLLVVLSFPFIAGSFAAFVIMERESKAKHLQTVAGVEPSAYWLSTFFWDTLNYQIPLWLTVAMMFIFKVDILTTSTRDIFSGVVAILFFFGPASAGFAYCLSFAFSSPSFCNIVLIISGFIIGMGGPLAIFILLLIAADPSNPKENLKHVATILTWILRFLPSFCLGKGLFFAINIEAITFLESDPTLSAWSEPVLLVEVYFLIGQSIAYTGLAILLDKWSSNPSVMLFWRKVVRFVTLRWFMGEKVVEQITSLPEDDDVIAEQDRVLSGGANEDLIVISQLCKVYSTGTVAVNNLSLGIHPGECFGLLGINGAGKTTTMGILTAEFPPSSGDATLAGFSITKEPQKIRRRIGYCPQFDAHLACLTGREHVELYASIKGIPKQFVKEAAANKLQEVGLSEYDCNRLSANYSGGMKRRLSIACATIGQPQIVFLDECSTGVDPVARREIWQLVSDMVAGGNIPKEQRTSVVLTTHSMEECEALCPRIGIMANGRLRCLGSAQHLKDKFGQGFQVELKYNVAERHDDDYIFNASSLAASLVGRSDEEALAVSTTGDDLFFNHQQAVSALQTLTGDDFLSTKITSENSEGYIIWKDSMSPVGVTLDGLAAFATGELRMRKIESFISENFQNHVLRERQETKARYEVSSVGCRISNIFSAIEEKKEELRLADYGVSQTSLEQVFNMHAAEAEKLKEGRDDR